MLPPLSRLSNRVIANANTTTTPSYLEPLETPSTPSSRPEPNTSTIRPPDAYVLRTSLFRRPEDLGTLRLEAAERFLRWREVERSVQQVLGEQPMSSGRSPGVGVGGAGGASASTSYVQTPKLDNVFSDTSSNPPSKSSGHGHGHGGHKRRRASTATTITGFTSKWDKSRWEAEWEGGLSKDVARTLRQRKRRATSSSNSYTNSRSVDEKRMTITMAQGEGSNSHQVLGRPLQVGSRSSFSPSQSRRQSSQFHASKYSHCQPHGQARTQPQPHQQESTTQSHVSESQQSRESRREYQQSYQEQGQQQKRRRTSSSSSTTLLAPTARVAQLDSEYGTHPNISLDPLHFTSILSFSLSLLSPLRSRIFGTSSSRRRQQQQQRGGSDTNNYYNPNQYSYPRSKSQNQGQGKLRRESGITDPNTTISHNTDSNINTDTNNNTNSHSRWGIRIGLGVILGAFCAGIGVGFLVAKTTQDHSHAYSF